MISNLDVRVYNQSKMFFNFTGPEVMIYGPATYDEKNVDRECAWMSLNTLIQEKFQKKLSIIAIICP